MSKKLNVFASSSKDRRSTKAKEIILISSSSGSSGYRPSSDEESEYPSDQNVSDSDTLYDPDLEEEHEGTESYNLSEDNSLDDRIMEEKYLRHKEEGNRYHRQNQMTDLTRRERKPLKLSTFKRTSQTVLVETSDGDFDEIELEGTDAHGQNQMTGLTHRERNPLKLPTFKRNPQIVLLETSDSDFDDIEMERTGAPMQNQMTDLTRHERKPLKLATFKRTPQTVLIETSDGEFDEIELERSDAIIIEVESTTEEIEMMTGPDGDDILIDSSNDDINQLDESEDFDPYGGRSEDDPEEESEEAPDLEVHIQSSDENMRSEENVVGEATYPREYMMYENDDVDPYAGTSEEDPSEEIPSPHDEDNLRNDALEANDLEKEHPEEKEKGFKQFEENKPEERVSYECLGTNSNKRIIFIESLTGEFEEYEMDLHEDAFFTIQSISEEIGDSFHGVKGATSGGHGCRNLDTKLFGDASKDIDEAVGDEVGSFHI